MIHSNIHLIYKAAVQRCGRSHVEKNKTQEKTITGGRNLGTVKATAMVPVALIQSDFHTRCFIHTNSSLKDFQRFILLKVESNGRIIIFNGMPKDGCV